MTHQPPPTKEGEKCFCGRPLDHEIHEMLEDGSKTIYVPTLPMKWEMTDLEEKLDELFPKGKCRERGQALVLYSYAMILFASERKRGREDVREYCLDERDKVADTTKKFNELNDEHKEAYWIAMNSVVKYIDTNG